MLDIINSSSTTAICIGFVSVITLVAIPLLRLRNSKQEVVRARNHVPSKSAVLITGGSRGIGRSTAEHLANNSGYTVLVTVRKKSQYDQLENEGGNIHPVLMDVTNDNDVETAVDRVKNVLKAKKVKLVAIVNNAGINPEGDELARLVLAKKEANNELADPSVATRVFETNVVGIIRVTKAFLPLLTTGNEGGGGRVVNIGSYFGSIAGKTGLGHACYEASKFALEGLSDNMRRSLKAEGNIKVCLIKPGNISTDMNRTFGEVGPEVVAKDIEHAIASANPRPRYYPGTVKGYSTELLCWIYEVLPTWLVDKL